MTANALNLTTTAGQVVLGNASGLPTGTTMSGDATINSSGALTLASHAVSNAKFRQSAALSLVGNSTNSTADVADISAASDNQVLRRSGTAIGFGSLDLSQSNTVGSSVLGQTNGGSNNGSGYSANGVIFQNSGNTAYTSDANFTTDGSTAKLGTSSAPTGTTQFTVSSSTQNSSRVTLSGQEFFQASNTSTDGLAFLLGTNRTNNRQLWVGDSARLTQNTTNPVLRFQIPANGSNVAIDSQATNGTTQLPITFGNTGAATTVSGSTTTVTGGAVSITGGDLDVTRNSTSPVVGKISNTNTANSGANARQQIVVGGGSGGDAITTYTVSGSQDWVIGLDNSVNDQFVIAATDTPGGSDRLRITTGGDVTVVSGNFLINTVGKGLQVKEGSNAKQGTFTLVAGTATVSNTSVGANSRIAVTPQNVSGTPGAVRVSGRSAGASFTVTAYDGNGATQTGDTSLGMYEIFEAA